MPGVTALGIMGRNGRKITALGIRETVSKGQQRCHCSFIF